MTVTWTTHQEERARDVAYRVNSRLPEAYRDKIFEEEKRVFETLLSKTGISERHILVIGGAGYIGTVLIGHLLDKGYRVRCLDLLLYPTRPCLETYLEHPRFEFVPGDFLDEDCVEKSLKGITDTVLLAGLVGDPITKKYPGPSASINHRGYEYLLNVLASQNLNKVIFVSTCSNYGLMDDGALASEDSPLSPLSTYATAKVEVESLVMELGDRHDSAATVLRFATAFGLSPRMRFDLTVSQFTRELAIGQELLVYDPDTWRPYCHVNDFSEVIRRVLEAPYDRVDSQIFNAGGDENNFTKKMIVDSVLREVPDGRVAFMEKGPDPRNYRVDFSKIRDHLYFEPKFSVRDGVRELLAAIREGKFLRIDNPPSFYGNYEISYPQPAALTD